MSSELFFDKRFLKRLSPRKLPKLAFFSADGDPTDPREKLPKAPIGEKAEFCDADCHDPLVLVFRGLVALRFSVLKGEPMSIELSRDCPSLAFSSSFAPVVESLKSVFRRRRAGGGVAVLGSSRKNREFPVGDIGLATESPVPRRRGPGRAELGEGELKELM